jgi:DNA-binding HxlR family transcriptional regulator
MDRRTEQILDAMSHPGAALVFHLAAKGAMVEDELVRLIADSSQATVNRRLQRLQELGVLVRSPGPKQYRDRPWALATPEAIDALLGASTSLARAIDQEDERRRLAVEAELRAGRKRRRGFEVVDVPDIGDDAPRTGE